jgi:hypothetical protein
MKKSKKIELKPARKVIEESISTFTLRAMSSYATAVNEDRSVPDLADGLKPVHRRVLWAAQALLSPGQQTKSARLSGECFAAGTQVSLIGGKTIPIEQVVVGDTVLTDKGTEDVSNIFEISDSTLYEVTTDKCVVHATPDQVFYCVDKKGKEVERTPLTLKTGDRIKYGKR